MIVHDVEFHGIDGLVEPERTFLFPGVGKDFRCDFLPAFSQRLVDFLLRDGFWVGEVGFKFLVVFDERTDFFLGEVFELAGG